MAKIETITVSPIPIPEFRGLVIELDAEEAKYLAGILGAIGGDRPQFVNDVYHKVFEATGGYGDWKKGTGIPLHKSDSFRKGQRVIDKY